MVLSYEQVDQLMPCKACGSRSYWFDGGENCATSTAAFHLPGPEPRTAALPPDTKGIGALRDSSSRDIHLPVFLAWHCDPHILVR